MGRFAEAAASTAREGAKSRACQTAAASQRGDNAAESADVPAEAAACLAAFANMVHEAEAELRPVVAERTPRRCRYIAGYGGIDADSELDPDDSDSDMVFESDDEE